MKNGILKHLLYILVGVVPFFGISQGKSEHSSAMKKPKLVVGIVVDQMRYDYLTRFYHRYGNGGFKRLAENGFVAKNHHVNFIPTKTAPGHASIYTGTTPQSHGILGNFWYDRFTKETVYCVDDTSVNPVGTSSYAGRKSPRQLLVSTLGDQMKLHSQGMSKVVSIAIKDRASILSAGHTADAAYWFRGKALGAWITSSFYQERLPQWVQDFNNSRITDSYFKTWSPFYPYETYMESGPDDTSFERGLKVKEKAVFPYDLTSLRDQNGNYDLLRQTPYGNSLTVAFAIAAIREENLGKDEHTDLLAISFSSTDYIGHNFGVNSVEVEDTYIRLDKDLELLLDTLDMEVGKGSYTIFLTADHGATHVPEYLKSIKIPASYFKEASTRIALSDHLYKTYNIQGIAEHMSNNQVYIDHSLIHKENLNIKDVENEIARFLRTQKGVEKTYTRINVLNRSFNEGTASLIKNGYHQKRSGDVIFTTEPSTVAYTHTGSAHGSGYAYDTHVPLLLYGMGIRSGVTTERTEITDIAPTVSAMLGITFPNKNAGTIIQNVIDKQL